MVASAIHFGVGTLGSRFLGLLRDTLLVNMLSREITDAYNVAFKIPNLFRRLFGEGALSLSFIPVFIDLHRNRKNNLEAKRLVDGVYTLLASIMMVATVLGMVFMDPIIRTIAGGVAFASVPGKIEMTIEIGRYCMGFVFFICLFALFMAILNGLQQFWWSGIAPAFSNITVIIGVALTPYFKDHVAMVLGLGVLAGGLMQWAVLIPSVKREGFLPKWRKHIFDKDVLRVLKPLGPNLIGAGSLQVTMMINTYFASHFPEGTNTYIPMADRVLELPLSLIAVSLQTALLPTLAGYWATGAKTQMVSEANKYLRFNYFLAVPCAVGMFVLAVPIVSVLFAWKGFSLEEVHITATIVQVYSFILLTVGGVRIISQSFYAMSNTWIPALISVFATSLHWPIVKWMSEHYGLIGLNASTLVTSVINLTLLVSCFKFKVGDLHSGIFFKSVSKFFVIAAVMGGILYGLIPRVFDPTHQSKVLTILSLGGLCALGGVIYFGLGFVFRVEEVRPLMDRFQRRFRRNS